MDRANPAFDLRFGGEALPPLAHRLEKNGLSSKLWVAMAHLLLILVYDRQQNAP